jgi:GT2 family glycosyltransferase
MKRSLSVVIPVYKNTEQFLNLIRHNKKYFETAEVVIVNDDPDSPIKEKVEKVFPEAHVFDTQKNRGFAGNVNFGVKKATGEYVLLLNSDVKLLDTSFKKAFNLFSEHPDLFAVSFAQKEHDGRIVGANTVMYVEGLFNHDGRSVTGVHPNFWAEGGSMIFKRTIYEALGGLDTLYSPFYWEDIDLSYRARKKGYEVLFDSDIMVEHHHESTIKTYFQQQFIDRISYRNQFIFHWKNLTDKTFIYKHLAFLPLHLMRALKDKNWPMILGFLDTLIRLPVILKKRDTQVMQKTDAQILALFTYET